MTTNQTIDGVPRELLVRLLEVAVYSASAPYRELRALLDAPAVQAPDKCGVQMVDCPECSHQWDNFFECGNKPAANPQGEPVYQVEYVGGYSGWRDVDEGTFNDLRKDHRYKARIMYAEQPAPVAVVLPGRKNFGPCDYAEKRAAVDGWNAYDDEYKRLNGIKP